MVAILQSRQILYCAWKGGMKMGVVKPMAVLGVEKKQPGPTKTYRIDFEQGRITGTADGVEAVNQAIKKALLTPRFHCLIYDNQYGSEIKDLIGRDVTQELIEAEIPRMVKDALKGDNRILDVRDVSFSFSEESCFIISTVDTVYGTSKSEVKI